MCSGVSAKFPVDHKEKWCMCRIYSKMRNIKDLEGMFLPGTVLPYWSCICINMKWGAIPHYTLMFGQGSNKPQPLHLHAFFWFTPSLSLPPFYPCKSKYGSQNTKVTANRKRSDLTR